MICSAFIFLLFIAGSISDFSPLGFSYLGSYNTSKSEPPNIVNIIKSYHLSTHYREVWSSARLVCLANGMDLLQIESEEERAAFNYIYSKNYALFTEIYYHIGGLIKIVGQYDKWYWVNGDEIAIQLQFNSGEPNNYGGHQSCLALEKYGMNLFNFNDIDCSVNHKEYFICQTLQQVFLNEQ